MATNVWVKTATSLVLGLAFLAATAPPAVADMCDEDKAEPARKHAREASRETVAEPSRDAAVQPGADASPPSAETRSEQPRQ